MKKVILGILLILGLVSCDEKVIYEGKTFSNYDMYVDYSVNHLKSPIVFVKINKYLSVTKDTISDIMVKDNDNVVKVYTGYSDFTRMIISNYQIGDTIR